MTANNTLRHKLFLLLSSMRFAVALLTVLAIASAIGTVIRQNEPFQNYIVEFGPFWFALFERIGLFDIYHSAWFLLILSFLILSTALCIVRNTPGFLRDIRSYRTQASDSSLALMKHQTQIDPQIDESTLSAFLQRHGYRWRRVQRDDGSVLLAAKKGSLNRLGYFFAHGALVVICLGGLLDGNLPLKLAELTGSIKPFDASTADTIPAHSRLGTDNMSYRARVTVNEGQSSGIGLMQAGRGQLVQDLPFIITLKKFRVDYYSNGMPKLFASDVTITDKTSGQRTEATIQVNHPVTVNGVTLYQAGFDDGGSPLKLNAWNLAQPTATPTALDGVSQNSQPLRVNGKNYQLEFGPLRVFNIEDVDAAPGQRTFGQQMADAREVRQKRKVKNLGPSISYRVRDSAGQAREYQQYMAPITQRDLPYLMFGLRSDVNAPFDYFGLPLDDEMQVDTFMRLRAVLLDPSLRAEIARRATAKALQGKAIDAPQAAQFNQSVQWVLSAFADKGLTGLQISDPKLPEAQRRSISEISQQIMQGAAMEAWALAEERAGKPAPTIDEKRFRFLLESLVAISELKQLPDPVLLQLTGFEQVQASGLEATRSPGKNLVYLGSLLLVLGIMLMLYIREVRLWLLIKPGSLLLAMSANRHERDLDQLFDAHRNELNTIGKPDGE